MDLSFSAQDLAFRDDVRAFVDESFDADMQAEMAASRNDYLPKEAQVRWQKRLYEKGWAAPNWPVEYGGPGWTPTQKYLFDAETSAAGCPNFIPFGRNMVAPVIMKFGTQAQKDKYLPDILASNVWWCQGYSEPGAGSDLASLKMRCEDQGDHYLCNGSKIWTSAAQHADMIFCLVRSENTAKPQEGISFLLIDMKSAGVTVEPIITIDQPEDGLQEVNQVFFEDVKVPKENLVGAWNQGWTCAKYLLEFERGNAYTPRLKSQLRRIRKIAASMPAHGQHLANDSRLQAKLAAAEIEIEALHMTELRILGRLSAGQNMGPESSLMKCRGTELQQLLSSLALEVVGIEAMPHSSAQPGSNNPPVFDGYGTVAAPRYFNKRKVSIYAGSNEIQRNIMAKLILGM